MVRSVLVLTLLSAPAWAVGERIALSKGPEFVEQLRDTLCISMECGRGVDASISAKVIKGKKAEIKVLSATGAVKATITAPLNEEGRFGSMDLVAATSGIIAAIEGRAVDSDKAEGKAEKTDKVEKADKKAKMKAWAAKQKKKSKSGLKVASKGRSAHSPG